MNTESSSPLPLNKYKPALRIIKLSVAACLILTILMVVLYSFINPQVTYLMMIRAAGMKAEGKKPAIYRHWVPIEEISPHMIVAVVASEDNRFMQHHGIDRQAIQEAIEYNRRSTRTRGASTITQQTAKNVFLWPGRTFVRKGVELYFTLLIELFWSKKRIMEVYLNVIETGDGVFGVDAAARRYFNKTAAQLGRTEAAMIAISLPNPRQRNPAMPSSYMIGRCNTILSLMDKLGKVEFK